MLDLFIYGIVWALWRRILGGWIGLRRAIVNSVIPIFLIPIYLHCPHYVDMAIITAITYAYWLCHVDYNQWWIVLRYPIVGASYPLLKKVWRNEWNMPQFIDGYSAVAELFIGFTFGCFLYWFYCL